MPLRCWWFLSSYFLLLKAHLYAQFAWDVPKGQQLLGVFADTLQVVVTELVLRVDQGEDSFHQPGPEVWEDLRQTHTAPCGRRSNCELTSLICPPKKEDALHSTHSYSKKKNIWVLFFLLYYYCQSFVFFCVIERLLLVVIYVLFDVIHIQSAIHAVWQTRMRYWLSSSSGSSLQTETASRAKTRKTQSKNRISRLRDSSSLSPFSFYKVFLAFSLYIKNCADYSRLIKAAGDLTQQGSDDNQRHLSTNWFPQFKKPKKWFLTWSYLWVAYRGEKS